jgi:hypothetical protein
MTRENTDTFKALRVKQLISDAEKYLLSLIDNKKSGKYEITVEVNLSQGAVGESFLNTHSREKFQMK